MGILLTFDQIKQALSRAKLDNHVIIIPFQDQRRIDGMLNSPARAAVIFPSNQENQFIVAIKNANGQRQDIRVHAEVRNNQWQFFPEDKKAANGFSAKPIESLQTWIQNIQQPRVQYEKLPSMQPKVSLNQQIKDVIKNTSSMISQALKRKSPSQIVLEERLRSAMVNQTKTDQQHRDPMLIQLSKARDLLMKDYARQEDAAHGVKHTGINIKVSQSRSQPNHYRMTVSSDNGQTIEVMFTPESLKKYIDEQSKPRTNEHIGSLSEIAQVNHAATLLTREYNSHDAKRRDLEVDYASVTRYAGQAHYTFVVKANNQPIGQLHFTQESLAQYIDKVTQQKSVIYDKVLPLNQAAISQYDTVPPLNPPKPPQRHFDVAVVNQLHEVTKALELHYRSKAVGGVKDESWKATYEVTQNNKGEKEYMFTVTSQKTGATMTHEFSAEKLRLFAERAKQVGQLPKAPENNGTPPPVPPRRPGGR